MSNWQAKWEAAKASGDFSALLNAIPYAQFLGLHIERQDGELITRMQFRPDLIGNPSVPALHGGTTGALMESAAIFQLLSESETLVLPKTVSITIDYLRPARPVDVFAQGIITRHGRRVANVRVEAWQEERARPVATANALFLLK